ncbi:MAG: hypothetical protein CSA58_10620 [Micrococcales bacterium]|nr:MAG: hypothetical protein CSA58_10620 [Micrococcales bacterium]
MQFWTTRGFALLHVNYSGSCCFGRQYRERLLGRWGELDIDDCVTGATSLADAGQVDGDRMAIRGGSAGGYVVMRAMTTTTVFAAGTSYFGVTDLKLLAAETHRFESRYLDSLVGPLPEYEARYAELSPTNHADRLAGSLLMLHGDADEVVPLSQAKAMADALRAADKRIEMVVYPGEGHGFRSADAIVDSISRELAFYRETFGLAGSG